MALQSIITLSPHLRNISFSREGAELRYMWSGLGASASWQGNARMNITDRDEKINLAMHNLNLFLQQIYKSDMVGVYDLRKKWMARLHQDDM
eukprot:91842-Amphidinium_carterae.3